MPATMTRDRTQAQAPTRPIERDYLVEFVNGVPLGRWQNIVARAVEQAEQGDRYAREFLARYLLPTKPDLLQLAIEERDGKTSAKIIQEAIPSVLE